MSAKNTAKAASGCIWANLIHLSYNMWGDGDHPKYRDTPLRASLRARPYLRFDDNLWDELLVAMARAGMNMVVIDVGDGIKYESHPEISVKGAWTHARLKRELAKVRKLGLEPIPKLNFSTTHDVWLSPYDRQVSTDAYYAVCRDLIAEVMALFDRPRLFHLGMDEEKASIQSYFQYIVVRQEDLWWHDLNFLVDQVERGGSRAWVWADQLYANPDRYVRKMPRSVLQSNGYYRVPFPRKPPKTVVAVDEARKPSDTFIGAFSLLEKHRFDQVPVASNHESPLNFSQTVAYCRKVISAKRLLGFFQTPWRITQPVFRDHHLQAITQVGNTIRKYYQWLKHG